METTSVRLGEFSFDATTGELTRGETVTRLRPQAARALDCLTRRPGQLVTRDELSEWIWPDGRIDSDLGLNVCITQVRAALEDDADEPRYVETLRARGYRLVAEVTSLPRTPTARSRYQAPRLLWGILAVAGLGITAGLMRADSAAEPTPLRLAVMPFGGPTGADTVEYSREEYVREEYIREGLAEDVITTLAKNDPAELAVVARTSAFRLAAQGLDPLAAAEKLDVNYVLQGSLRSTGSGYRLTARLLDVASTTYLWSEQYDLQQDELLEVDKDIARGVLSALPLRPGETLVAQSPAPASVSPQARDAVLRARFLIGKRTRAGATTALEFLDLALGPDSVDSAALVGLARAHLLLGHLDQAEQAIGRARVTGPGTPGLDLVAGRVALYGRSDVPAAVDALARAIELQPGAAEARHTYAQALAAAGRLDDAVVQGELALALDPISSAVRGDIGWVFYYAREYTRAREHCGATLELVPESTGARICTILAAHFENDLASEEKIVGEVLASLQASAAEVADLTLALREGDSESLWQWLLEKATESGQLDGINVARLLALLDRPAEAARTLQNAAESGQLALWVGVDPVFEPLRGRPDFEWARSDQNSR